MKKLLPLLALLPIIFSCTKKSTPETVLREFVAKRFSESFSVNDFKEYLGGEILEEVTANDGEYIEKINETNKFKMGKFKVNAKRCIEDKCFLTYSLDYKAPYEGEENTESNVSITVRKIAEMKKDQGAWKIFGITDVKTNFDYQE